MSQIRSFNHYSLYNTRMNQQLLNCCLLLTPEQCLQSTHSFFPNVIAYWNHLLFGDLILLRRIVSNNVAGLTVDVLEGCPVARSPNDVYGTALEDLVVLRTRLDGIIDNVINTLTETDLSKVIHYQTTEGLAVSARIGDVLQHMFNHQTHHRGQLTCVLSQFNIDFGCTDLPALVPEMSVS
jgi:uncharacterized damage-inducible protein DinB